MFDNVLHGSLYSASTTDSKSSDTIDVSTFLDEHILHDWKDAKSNIAKYLSLELIIISWVRSLVIETSSRNHLF